VPTIRIDDLSDPRVSGYRNVRDADLIRDRESFIAEGRFVLAALLRGSRYPIRSVLLNEAAHSQLTDLLAQIPDETPVYVAPQGIMDEIVGFPIHRGCLAEGDRSTALSAQDVITQTDGKPIDVLEDLTNHDNVGGIFRTADALNIGGILLTERCADPLYRKAIRVSMGSALRLPWSRSGSIGDILRALKASNYTIIATTPDESAIDLRTIHDHPAMQSRSPVAQIGRAHV